MHGAGRAPTGDVRRAVRPRCTSSASRSSRWSTATRSPAGSASWSRAISSSPPTPPQFGTTEIAVGLWPMMITAEISRSRRPQAGARDDADRREAHGRARRSRAGSSIAWSPADRARGRDHDARRPSSPTQSPAAIAARPARVLSLAGHGARAAAPLPARRARRGCSRSRTPPRASPRSCKSARRCGRESNRSVMTILRIDHVQLSIPPDGEADGAQVLRRAARHARGGEARADAQREVGCGSPRACTSGSSPR